MKKLILSFVFFSSLGVFAQVGIGVSTANMDASAQLDISSTTKGLLAPRMTAIQKNAITNPATGLLIYQIDATTGFYYFDGSVWKSGLGPEGIQGVQGATGLQGAAGIDGAIGLQGVQGPQGEIGLTGSQGDQGVQGETGPQGAIGATGLIGPQGEIGVQGPQGEIGLTGPQGDQGVQGEIGLTGVTGPAGSNASITMGAISGSSNSNGASITSGVLILTPADATNGGIVTNDTQTIAGDKTFVNSVAIGAASSTPSAVVEITSTSQGFLLPRMTVAQRIAISSPVSGLSVYQTDDVSGFYYYDGSVWKQSLGLVSSGTNGQVLTADGAGNATWTTASLSSSSGNTHAIGESYGGGIVFYVYDDGQHGLIAATSDQSSGIRWYNNVLASNNSLLVNASRDGIGAGKWNTERIIANQGAGNYAAQLCANYQGGGMETGICLQNMN